MNIRGTVRVWPGAYDGAFDHAVAAMQAQHRNTGAADRHFTIDLRDYNGPWRHPDDNNDENTTRIALDVRLVNGSSREFDYVGKRIYGPRTGDMDASRGQAEEWYHIYVDRSTSIIKARWEKVKPLLD